jgi:hypothetical protein
LALWNKDKREAMISMISDFDSVYQIRRRMEHEWTPYIISAADYYCPFDASLE